MRRGRRRGCMIWLVILLVLVAVPVAIVGYVNATSRPYIYATAADAPARPVAIVFGAGLRRDGYPSDVLRDRLRVGVELYQQGKVTRLFMTGGGAEPAAMQQFAEAARVPSEAITTDALGLRTYDSCRNAQQAGITAAVLVTQNYHLPRAIYTCRKLGLDVVGVRSDLTAYRGQAWFSTREFFATVLAWLDVRMDLPAT